MKTGQKAIMLGFLVTILALGGSVNLAQAQAASPTPTQTLTPSPGAGYRSPAEVDAEIKDLQNSIQDLKEKILPFTVLMATLGVLGLISPYVVWKLATDYHKKSLQDAFYKADARNFPVYIPKRNFETEKKNLEKLGFRSLRPYEFLDEVAARGVVVYHIPGSNFERDESGRKHMLEELRDLKRFVNENREKPLAYVIYIRGQPKEIGEFIISAGNVASANMPVTIAAHIYTLARGLMD